MRGISQQGKTLSDITYLTKPKQLESMKELNKLIAEFMDVFPRQGEERTGMKEFYSPIDLDISGLPDELTLADDLDFRQWHWIMPVVEKIYQLDSNANFFGSINLEATYKEVVEFIKAHNKKA